MKFIFFTMVMTVGLTKPIFAVEINQTKLDTASIEKLTGLKGQFNEKENVFKISYPREDLKVTVAGVKMTPAMGLTAWAAFTPMKDHVMVMGDMVMTEDQVNDVMSAALDSGLEVTALHNHFFGDKPKVMFMHIGGMGPSEKIATAVGAVFDTLKKTAAGKGSFPMANIDASKSKIDGSKIDSILGTKGKDAKGVFKVTIGRKAKMDGAEVGNEMGVNTWAAFAGADSKAVVDGDFAMYKNELQSVLKALRSGGINIVAIHNHMADEEPRMVFLHYWGLGTTAKLASTLKAALDTQEK